MRRVWRAFCRGFWMAWLEVVPSAHKTNLVVTISCDTSDFDRKIDDVIERLRQMQHYQIARGTFEVMS